MEFYPYRNGRKGFSHTEGREGMDSFGFVLLRDFTMLDGVAQKVPNHLNGGGGGGGVQPPYSAANCSQTTQEQVVHIAVKYCSILSAASGFEF